MSEPTSTLDCGTDESESTADRTLRRRDLVTTIGGIAGISILAGCSSGSDGDGSEDDAGANGSGSDTTDGDAADGEDVPSDGSGSSDDGGSGTGETGDESEEQVANHVVVLATVGTVGADGESISELRITVAPPDGGTVNLAEVTIQYVATEDFANLIHTAAAEGGDTAFATSPITAADTSNSVMSEEGDRYEITIPIGTNVSGDGDNSDLAPLAAGESAELTFTTNTGAQTTATLQVPDSLGGESSGDTVTL